MSKPKMSASRARNSRVGKDQNAPAAEDKTTNDIPQLSWKVLSEKDTESMSTMSLSDVVSALAGALDLSHHRVCLKEAALLDYYVTGYWFTRENKFSLEQTSAFVTLLHHFMNNLKEKQMSLLDNVQDLQVMLKGVGVSNETCLRCFTIECAKLSIEYLTSSLFQHYRLFQYMFTEDQQDQYISSQLSVTLPASLMDPCPPPLEEGLPLELYQRCVAPPEDQTEEGQDDEQPQQEASGCDELPVNISPSEVKAITEQTAKHALHSYQTQLSQQLREKEDSVLGTIQQLEQNLDK